MQHGAALASYVGSVCWLYEKPVAGKVIASDGDICASLEPWFEQPELNANSSGI